MLQKHVPQGLWVQLPPSARIKKLRGFARRLAKFGGLLILYFELKNELVISFEGKKIF